jgi:hypothetical protein
MLDRRRDVVHLLSPNPLQSAPGLPSMYIHTGKNFHWVPMEIHTSYLEAGHWRSHMHVCMLQGQAIYPVLIKGRAVCQVHAALGYALPSNQADAMTPTSFTGIPLRPLHTGKVELRASG